MSNLIYAVDDEPDILELVSLHLKKANFEVQGFEDGQQFFEGLKAKQPSLVILDLMLPDYDGLEICKILRADPAYTHLPVLMLTAKGEELDRILGLELGADDYVSKPFSPRELVARVKAILRRGPAALEPSDDPEQNIQIAEDLILDLEGYELRYAGQKVDLTSTEFKILKLLSLKQGKVFSREKILDDIYDSGKAVLDRTVDVHIKNMREKLGEAAKYLKNVRGVGYKFEVL